jgi:hypothetical protein
MVAHCGDYNGARMMRQPEFPHPESLIEKER